MKAHDTQTLIATFSIYLAICLALGFIAWRRTQNAAPRLGSTAQRYAQMRIAVDGVQFAFELRRQLLGVGCAIVSAGLCASAQMLGVLVGDVWEDVTLLQRGREFFDRAADGAGLKPGAGFGCDLSHGLGRRDAAGR